MYNYIILKFKQRFMTSTVKCPLRYNSKGDILKYISKIRPYLISPPPRSGIFSQFFLLLFFLTSLSELKEKKIN